MLLLAVHISARAAGYEANPITRAHDVVLLPEQLAAQELPADLECWVTYTDKVWNILFVQDESGGTFIGVDGPFPGLDLGARLHVTGRTFSGEYAPSVGSATITRLEGYHTPVPRRVAFDEFLMGRWDSQFLEVECIVRSVEYWGDHLAFRIIEGAQSTFAILPYIPEKVPALIGAKVRIQGVSGAAFNRNRQVIRSQLLVQNLDLVEVLTPAPAQGFDAPLSAVRELNRYTPDAFLDHRVRLQGTVLAFEPGASVFLRDNTGSIRIATLQREPTLVPGDQIVVTGFRAVNESRIVLESGEYEKVGSTHAPTPATITAEEANTGLHDGELVSLIAEVVGVSDMFGGCLLSMATPEAAFTAWLPLAPQDWKRPVPHTVVGLTGICMVDKLDLPENSTFQIRLRDTQDVEIVSAPSWWGPRHSMGTALAVSALLILASAWGVTLRKRVHQQTERLEESLQAEMALERRFRSLFESSPDAMIVFDDHGRVVDCNPAATRMFGTHTHNLSDLAATDLVAEDHRNEFRAQLQEFFTKGMAKAENVFKTSVSGGTLPVELHIGRVDYSDRPCILMQVRDISQRKSLENQLLQSQKMEAIGQLAAGVAHDFNNILTVISGHLSLLADDFPPTDHVALAFSDMRHAVDRASRLTRQLLTFSRRQPTNLAPVSLNDVVTNMTRMLRYVIGENYGIDFNYSRGSTLIRADVGMIEQIIVNLAVNARDAMVGGGKMTIRTTQETLRADDIRMHPTRRTGDFVSLSVADEGCGMTPEVINRIFEPFFTTKEMGKGTGLGLATVYGIIQEHSGWIEVESEPGRGSKFTLYFPQLTLSQEIEIEAERFSYLPPKANGSARILIAEDEEPVRKLLGDILDRRGFAVKTAEDGPEAESIWTSSGDFDLLITDMIMPEGVDGFELARRLQKRKPMLKVIYCTGYPPDQFECEVPLIEGENLLRKPFTPQSVAEIVHRSLSASKPA